MAVESQGAKERTIMRSSVLAHLQDDLKNGVLVSLKIEDDTTEKKDTIKVGYKDGSQLTITIDNGKEAD